MEELIITTKDEIQAFDVEILLYKDDEMQQ